MTSTGKSFWRVLTFTCLAVLNGAARAHAQAPAQAPPVASDPAPPPVNSQESSSAAPDVAPATEPTDTGPTEADKLISLEGKVEGLTESTAADHAVVDRLSKIKVSGYIQGRYEWRDDSNYGVDAKGAPREFTRFYVRRARLKTLYANDNTEFMLQIDATGEGVTLKDAEATLVDTWTPFGLRLTAGQFKVPFGYEILQSSGDREMPERVAVIGALFPGERDRGLRLQGRYEWFRLQAALINGTFNEALYKNNFDQTSFKDLVGRLGADFGNIVLGVSGYWGHTLKSIAPAAGSTDYTYERYARLRLGADAQFYYDMPLLGGFALKGEVIWSRDKNMSFSGSTIDPCKNLTSFGWYVAAIQNVGETWGAVVRVDSYDRNSGLASTCAAKTIADSHADRVTSVGGGVLLYFPGGWKGTLVYLHIAEQDAKQVDNDVLTFQMQAKF